MQVTQQPLLRRFWYPVIPMEQLQSGPQRFVLLGQPLVLWLDLEGGPQAVLDRCPHRSAQLSLGRVVQGAVQCPYHGWQFNGAGICVKVPQLETGAAIPHGYRVQGFHCTPRYGYAWVCLSPDPLDPIPAIPEVDDPRFRLIQEFYEPWRASGLRIMENSFDSAHPHFVHAKSFGDQSNPVPPPLDEVIELEDGLVMRHWIQVLNPDLQKGNLGIATDKTLRTNERRWYRPFARTLKITYPNGLIHIIFTAATPIDDHHSQLVQFCVRNDSEAQAPAAGVIAFDRQVTEEDRVILETTEADVPLEISREQHMASDKPGVVMRRHLAALLRSSGG